MMRWTRACWVLSLSLSLPLARASAQKLDLDEFLKPSSPKAAPPDPTGAAATPPESARPVASSPPVASGPAHPATSGPAHTAARAHAKSPGPDTAEATPAVSAPARESEPVAASGGPRHTTPAGKRERAAKMPRAEKPKRAKKKTVYDLMCEGWHAPPEPELVQQWRAAAVPDLVFRVHKTGAMYTLRPNSREGDFDETQLQIAKAAFDSWGPTPHPRTLGLVYKAALRFNAPYVTLISGVRKDRGGSRHSHGLAADIVLPGVDDETLAAFFRAQGFCGVGTYPHSGFVHVDTRDASYFWIDSSKPNQHGRVVQVRKEESAAADAAALARGASFVNPPKLQKALNVRLVRKRKQHQAKLERAAAAAARQAPPKPPTTPN